MLRPVYDRLWDSDQARVAKQVWREIQSGRTAVDCTPAGKDTDDLVRGGQGWMVRGREGVLVTVRNAGLPAESVEVRFRPTADADYRHLTRDFFVEPETDYLLRAEVRTEGLTPKDGPRLVLAAPKRFIASSIPIAGANTWVPVTLRLPDPPGRARRPVGRGQRPIRSPKRDPSRPSCSATRHGAPRSLSRPAKVALGPLTPPSSVSSPVGGQSPRLLSAKLRRCR